MEHASSRQQKKKKKAQGVVYKSCPIIKSLVVISVFNNIEKIQA